MQAYDRIKVKSADGESGASREPVAQGAPRVQVQYNSAHQSPPDTRALLAAVRFGAHPVQAPLTIDVALEILHGEAHAECWAAHGAVRVGASRRIQYAHDDHYLFGVIELDEQAYGGIRDATASAYEELQAFHESTPFRHPLRIWNYLDAINDGPGDLERYREFCVGRAHALAQLPEQRLPAATAIGRRSPTGTLQVFWLAGCTEGAPIENPRQVSAYRYPPVHGPKSPSFSRATAAPDGAVLISGTASIVGHASQHDDDPQAQLEETIRNLDALTSRAGVGAHAPHLLKAYVRCPAHAPAIEARLREVYPRSQILLLAAEICRRELLLEIEGVWLAAP